MSDLLDLIKDTEPSNNATSIPLRTTVIITLSGLDYDEDSITEGLFLEGPDTDQFVGPGMQLLTYPDNISQGDPADFFESPGYYGLVNGTTTVSGINGDTVVSFISTQPFAPLTNYKVNLSGILAGDGTTTIDGFVTLEFTTGSGSIQQIPSTVSTSILNLPTLHTISDTTGVPLQVVKITPNNRSVENAVTLREIIVEFNKEIDPTSVNIDNISIIASAITDHPKAVISAQGELVLTFEVSGKFLILKI